MWDTLMLDYKNIKCNGDETLEEVLDSLGYRNL